MPISKSGVNRDSNPWESPSTEPGTTGRRRCSLVPKCLRPTLPPTKSHPKVASWAACAPSMAMDVEMVEPSTAWPWTRRRVADDRKTVGSWLRSRRGTSSGITQR